MSPWYGIALYFPAMIASIVLRAPHANRSSKVKVVQSRKGGLEIALLVAVGIGCLLLPILYATTPVLAFADYPLRPWAFAAGAVFVVLWLWLFHRSHTDLGTNWSVTLEVRENHTLITRGVYGRIRHPMYTSLFCNAIAQALLLANWIAGPAMLITFTLMFFARLGPEEGMMRERFGEEYASYAKRTKRLVPGVW
jgi:protein-S-isoprenylcysteine O-methyltransferase Ste14